MASTVWNVVWVDDAGYGHGACGHRHPDADDATMCPFEPEALPVVCAGLVREVRDPLALPERRYAAQLAPRQLELALGAG